MSDSTDTLKFSFYVYTGIRLLIPLYVFLHSLNALLLFFIAYDL